MTIFATPVAGPDGLPLDQVRLTGVTATGHHGVFAHERQDGQEFRADVVLHLDTRPAAAGDDLGATVSYADVAEDVHAVLAGSPADLVETVAERIAAAVLAYPAVAAVDVRVHKPQAPISVPFEDVEVAVRRDRVRIPVVDAFPTAGLADPAPAADALPAPVAEPLEAATLAGLPPVPEPLPGAGPLPAVRPGEAAAVPLAADATSTHAADASPDPVVPAVGRLDAEPPEPVDVVLAIGANLGDPQTTLRQAVADLDSQPGLQVLDASPLARTAAVGGPDQPDYLNAVLLARTTLSARALLRACQAVEEAHGRVREERWGPRTLDVDVVAYGSLVAADDELEVPHPRAHERAFVLVPWTEVQPDAVLPGLGGGPVARLAETAPDRAGIRWMALDWLTEPTTRSGMLPAAPVAAVAQQDAFGDQGVLAGEGALAEAGASADAEPHPLDEGAGEARRDVAETSAGEVTGTADDVAERGEPEPLVTGVPTSPTGAAPEPPSGPWVEDSGVAAPRPFVEPVGRADAEPGAGAEPAPAPAPTSEPALTPTSEPAPPVPGPESLAEQSAASPAPWELPLEPAPVPTERPLWAPVRAQEEAEAPRDGTAVLAAVADQPTADGAPQPDEPGDVAAPEREAGAEQRASRADRPAGTGTPDDPDAAR
jgi:dihydroneopterin aldolase/2-amino-4-hydroxy-6-hydroxymethyldihydropteridine diphosphokinase